MRSKVLMLSVFLAGCCGLATAQTQWRLASQRIASGLSRPLFVTAPGGETSRIYVVEQRNSNNGRIRIINIPANTLNATPYLTINPVATGNEQGLLGLAFHPNFMQNGYFYVDYTRDPEPGFSHGSTIVARYRATGGNPSATTADPASAQILLTIRQPDANHNGGWMAFGPDGYLYIATGDGGCGNDTNCGGSDPSVDPPGHTPGTGNAQDVTDNLLGKILRIDVDGPDNIPGNADDADPGLGTPYRIPAGNPFDGTNGDREIFAYGVRNPWRDSFDRLTGDIWIADVGQDNREEINFIPAGQLAGLNFGWRCMEGLRCTGLSGCTCNDAGLYLPILTYGHSVDIPPTNIQGCSITGGYVYRGSAIPCFRGSYIFADYCSGDIFTFRRDGDTLVEVQNRRTELEPVGTPTIDNVTSFGEDANGELYICDQSGGEIYKILPGGFSGPDCNNNGTPDDCDIAQGTSQDANGDGIPDECQLIRGDMNCDGVVDNSDIDAFVEALIDPAGYVAQYPNCNILRGDINGDSVVDNSDIDPFVDCLLAGGCP